MRWFVIGLGCVGLFVAGGCRCGDHGSGEPAAPPPVEMVTVPAGWFLMGCQDEGEVSVACKGAKPARQVYVDGFEIDKTEVTVTSYLACVRAKACPEWSQNADSLGPEFPISGISWEAARDYCAWRGARLPTEAEWEKAARGTDGRRYPWGNEPPSCERAQYTLGEAACSGPFLDVAGVRPKGASPYGALDMSGNAPEWVHDWMFPGYYRFAPDHNPKGLPEERAHFGRVVRGRSSSEAVGDLATYARHASFPEISDVGVRCARSLDAPPQDVAPAP